MYWTTEQNIECTYMYMLYNLPGIYDTRTSIPVYRRKYTCFFIIESMIKNIIAGLCHPTARLFALQVSPQQRQ